MRKFCFILALIALAFVACNSPSGSDGENPDSALAVRKYIALDSARTYTLTISSVGDRPTHEVGDTYEYTVTNGTSEKKSVGKVVSADNANYARTYIHSYGLQPQGAGAGVFSVTLYISRIRFINGSITFDDGSIDSGPGYIGEALDTEGMVVTATYSDGSTTMNSGEVSGNSGGSYSCGVIVNDGTFTMAGGEISGNIFHSGSGVWVDKGYNLGGGTFIMTGGVISGNTATSRGGGLYVDGNGTFRISNGTVYGSNANPATLANTATSGGAALYKVTDGTAEHGNGTTWTAFTFDGSDSYGSYKNGTIEVLNGVLQ